MQRIGLIYLYWAAKKSKRGTEFESVKRKIEFVEMEEELESMATSRSEYLFKKVRYEIG